MKKFISLLMAMCLIATSFCVVHADVAFDPTGWNEATNYYWKVEGTTLYLHYTGTAPDYNVANDLTNEDRPWIVANSSNRTSITSAVMTGNPGQVGRKTFFEMSNLSHVEFPEDIWAIGDFAFKGCPITGSMAIPKTVVRVGQHAFQGNLITSLIFEGDATTTTELELNYMTYLPRLKNITLMRPVKVNENTGNTLQGLFGANYDGSWLADTNPAAMSLLTTNAAYAETLMALTNDIDSDALDPNGADLGIARGGFKGYTLIDGDQEFIADTFSDRDVDYLLYYDQSGKLTVEFLTGEKATIDQWGGDINVGWGLLYNTIYDPTLHGKATEIKKMVFSEGFELIPANFGKDKYPSLEEVVFPSTLKEIQQDAFRNCPIKGALVLPESVTTIGDNAFNGSRITSLIFKGNSDTPAVTVGALNGMPKLGNITLMRPVNLMANTVIGVFGIKSESQWGTAENAWFANANPARMSLLTTNATYAEPFMNLGEDGISTEAGAFGFDLGVAHGGFKGYTLVDGTQNFITGTFSDRVDYILYHDQSAGLTVEFMSSEKTNQNGAIGWGLLWPFDAAYAPYAADGSINDPTLNAEAANVKKMVFAEGFQIIPEGFDKGNFANIEEVVLPSTLETIQKNTFTNKAALTKINLEDTKITTIGDSAFENCSLEAVAFPETITSIGDSAFLWCPLKGALVIPQTVTSIGVNAFQNTRITSLIFKGNSDTPAVTVGSLTGLPKLGNITLMRPVTLSTDTVIGVFGTKSESQWGTTENTWFANGNPARMSLLTTNASYAEPFMNLSEEGVSTEAGALGFDLGVAHGGFKGYTLIDGSQDFITGTFYDEVDYLLYYDQSAGLTVEFLTSEKTTKDVNVGDGMMGGYEVDGTTYSIKDSTLAAKAADIKKMVFSEGIEVVPDDFGTDSGDIYPNLEEVVYPSTRKQEAEFSGDIPGLSNGYWAFEGDTLHLYGNGEWTSNYNWGPQPWNTVDYTAIKKVVFHEGITTIPTNFAGPTSVTADKTWKMNHIEEITLPSTLKAVNDEAFIGVAVKKINGGFPEGLERIERQTFQNHQLDATVGEALLFPASLKFIGENAFHTGARYILEPADFSVLAFEEGSQLETIGPRAFAHEVGLKTVVIPEGVTEIGSRAFESDVDNGIVVYFEGNPTTIGATVFGTRRNVTLFSLVDDLTSIDGMKVTRVYQADEPIKAPNQTSAHILLTQPYDGVNGLLQVGETLDVKAVKTSAQNKLPGNFVEGTELPRITAQVVSENVVKIEGIPVLQAGEKIVLTLNGVKDTLGNTIENNTIVFYSEGVDNGLISAKFYDINGDTIEVTNTTIAAGTRKMVFVSTDEEDKTVELYDNAGSKVATATFADGVYTIEVSSLAFNSNYTLKRNGGEYITFTTDFGQVGIGEISVNGTNVGFNYYNSTNLPAKVYVMMSDGTLCQELSIAEGANGSFSGTKPADADMFVVDGLDTLKILRATTETNGVVAVDKTVAAVNGTPFDANRTVTFTGELGSGKHSFGVAIFKPTTTEKVASDVVYAGMVTTAEDGTFTLPVQFSEAMATGIYSVIMADGNGKFYENSSLGYSKKTDVEAAFTLINNAAKTQSAAADVYRVMTENAEKLEFVYDVYDETYANDPVKKAAYQKKVADFIAKEIQTLQATGAVGFTYAEKDQALAIFREAAIVAAFSVGEIANIADVENDISALSSEPVKTWYNEKVGVEQSITAAWQADMTQRLNGVQFASLDDFSEKLTVALVFSIIKNPVGTVSLIEALTDFGSDITSSMFTFDPATEITQKACLAIVNAGKDYSGFDYTDLIRDIKAYNARNIYEENSSGGGFGGGGFVDITVDSDLIQDTIPGTKSIFNDIEDYSWAKPAIEALYERGIVNGKAEGKFAPEDEVLREEFTKMIVLVADPKNGTRYAEFDDVTVNDWYYDYIQTAYKSGIINGVSENSFGAGRPITRQDMCVIIVNALKLKGMSSAPDGEIVFSDQEAIADYARSAVDKLTELGVLNGYEDNTFRPTDTATRAEAAKLIYALLELM